MFMEANSNHGNVNTIRNKEEIRNVFRWCAALVYLPMDKAHDAWLIIMENYPNNEKNIILK